MAARPPLRAVFLDVGNTLLYEEPARFEIYARAARRRGVEIDSLTMRQHMTNAHRELPDEIDGGYRYSDPWFDAYIQRIFHGELGIAASEVGAITRELFAAFEDPGTFRTFEGCRELLADARAGGLALGVISNWSARLPRVLAGMELAGAFDFVLCSAIERMEKPDPRIFRAALEQAGCAPEEALHAGDHPVKDGAAAELGIEFVLVDHAAEHAADRSGEHAANGSPARVGSLGELAGYIAERQP